ncbi:MAG: 3-hydroxyacyl-ACP dehydratase FabZ [Elusimicrobiaceae bacterium]|nr:3-hydroxyacyl-ACP dehydratase FabZ [Elusimicrobiaceae bacterium]
MAEEKKTDLRFLLAAPAVRGMDARAVMEAIPHRPPFLLVDRVDIIEERKYALGTKGVTMSEPWFQGHFPGQPLMPGVLMLEAMAQTCAAAVMSLDEYRGKIAYFLTIDGAKFRRPVFPGDTLRLAVEFLRLGRMSRGRGQVFVEGALVVEADMTFVFQPAATTQTKESL